MRLSDKVAVVVGAGQTPGLTIGNGRATALLFAREGAKVFAVDRYRDSAEETAALVREEGGEAISWGADITDEAQIQAVVEACLARFGQIDVLHNNVGVSLAGGDAPVTEITSEAFDRVVAINLRGMVLTCKHVLPHMRERERGVILNISSVAAVTTYPYVAYKATKAAVVAFSQQLADENAKYGVRANAILPGLMNTPMAIEARATGGRSREDVIAERDRRVPLKGGMGTAWDVAYAALFLASDEAKFITGVALPVDGGTCVRVG